MVDCLLQHFSASIIPPNGFSAALPSLGNHSGSNNRRRKSLKRSIKFMLFMIDASAFNYSILESESRAEPHSVAAASGNVCGHLEVIPVIQDRRFMDDSSNVNFIQMRNIILKA